jgi:DNA-binding XRE family transcriptional regulator
MNSYISGSSAADIIERMKLVSGSGTDAALARLLDVTPAAIVRWKINKSVPIAYCLKVADSFQSTLDYIYSGIKIKSTEITESVIDVELLEIAIDWELIEKHGNKSDISAKSILDRYKFAERIYVNLARECGIGRSQAVSVIASSVKDIEFGGVR